MTSPPSVLGALSCGGGCRPVEEKERVLTSAGPTWKAPTVMEVLRMLPFLRHTRRRVIQVRAQRSAMAAAVHAEHAS